LRFHAAYWKPASSALIFAGDITLADAVDLARRSFGSWSGGSAPLLAVPPPQPVGPGKVFMVDRADAAQTVVAQILPGPARSASDYYALTLADAVWGGGAGARLGTNIREEKGYSYGVFSFANANSKYGLWMASGGVQTNKTKEAVAEFQKELKFIAGGKPVSEKELVDARNNRIRGYAQEFESLGRVASVIQNLWNTGMPMTEIERQTGELQKATRESVNSAAEKYATPGKATLLLVGDLSKIENGVRELGIGDIIIVDVEGKPKR
jgi:zinc protease